MVKLPRLVVAFLIPACVLRGRIKDSDSQRLREEYNRLVQGLRESNENRVQDLVMGNPGMSSSPRLNPDKACTPPVLP